MAANPNATHIFRSLSITVPGIELGAVHTTNVYYIYESCVWLCVYVYDIYQHSHRTTHQTVSHAMFSSISIMQSANTLLSKTHHFDLAWQFPGPLFGPSRTLCTQRGAVSFHVASDLCPRHQNFRLQIDGYCVAPCF